MYDKARITIDLEEYQDMKNLITHLQTPVTEGDLSPAELQEATGVLLLRAIQNPRLFYGKIPEIPLGKYKAQIAYLAKIATGKDEDQLLVKLVRT